MAYQSFMRTNPAGSRFAMPTSGGTLSQLAVQPQHRMFAAPAGPASTTTSPGTMGPNGTPVIPGSPGAMTFQDYNAQQAAPVAAMAPPSASPFAPGGGGTDTRGEWLRNTPGYQFRFDEGMNAINRGAAAKGTLLTGGTLKELQERGQGMASQEFGAEADRLARLTQIGQNGAQILGSFGTGYGQGQERLAETSAANQVGLGNAQAGGTLAGVNATNAAGSQIANTLGQIDWTKLFGKKKPLPGTGPVMYGGPTDVTATA